MSETARRFGVHRATVKRYCKQLDERGTLQPRKAPGKEPKLDEKAMTLLLEDLEQRPWATYFQRAEFLFAACGVRISEATVCRSVGRLQRSRKKIRKGSRTRRVLEATLAHGGWLVRSREIGVRGRDGHSYFLSSFICLRTRGQTSLL
jgi:transposase